MKIENLRSEKQQNRTRVAATVIWEDCDRPNQELYFETVEAFSEDLSCNPHAFLIACAIPALHYGEERLFIDAEVCPELRGGLTTAMSVLHYWLELDRRPVQIEAKTRSSLSSVLPTPDRAGFFFSGGVDSFATLRTNRLNFPSEHPWSIKDGLLVYGLELDKKEAFDHVQNELSAVARKIDLMFIPVYTNVYLNYRQEDAANRFRFWIYEFQGAALAAVAHAFMRRFTVISIAATFDLPNLGIWGSHPLLDTNYSSVDLRIRHDGIALSRLEKTKLVADWDVALQSLRVCNQFERYDLGKLNCGQCEKCIRTMLALLALGALDRTSVFPMDNVSEELVREKANIHDDYVESCYRELIGPLAEKERFDLVRAIEHRLAIYHSRAPYWKKAISKIDRKYLDGNLTKLISRNKIRVANIGGKAG